MGSLRRLSQVGSIPSVWASLGHFWIYSLSCRAIAAMRVIPVCLWHVSGSKYQSTLTSRTRYRLMLFVTCIGFMHSYAMSRRIHAQYATKRKAQDQCRQLCIRFDSVIGIFTSHASDVARGGVHGDLSNHPQLLLLS
jgi:hypothetical protein